jgi:uncharacterized repeat protein (TIGR03803 family)
MRLKRAFIPRALTLTICTAVLTLASNASAAVPEKVLYTFTGGSDGGSPYSGLVFDSAGNLYGTTASGGLYGNGTVFELTPSSSGWSETALYSFTGGIDGSSPYGNLVFDKAGNLYGTTQYGGTALYGTAFELSPSSGGGWSETVLHSFGGGNDGILPYSGLIFYASGNLYGTTTNGGTKNLGTVFELSPPTGGSWTEKILHSFGSGVDGQSPFANLIFDSAGNLYDTGRGGGMKGIGTVFKLAPSSSGRWTETTLHSFNSSTTDGAGPFAGLVFDSAGNLYGTTYGEAQTCGNVFELSPSSTTWKLTVIHKFPGATGGGPDGCQPFAGLIFDSAGNLYGTTNGGGSSKNGGTVFKLTPKTGGGWTEKIVYRFQGGSDGAGPYLGSLILDAVGNLYGTTSGGGASNAGTVFEVTP